MRYTKFASHQAHQHARVCHVSALRSLGLATRATRSGDHKLRRESMEAAALFAEDWAAAIRAAINTPPRSMRRADP